MNISCRKIRIQNNITTFSAPEQEGCVPTSQVGKMDTLCTVAWCSTAKNSCTSQKLHSNELLSTSCLFTCETLVILELKFRNDLILEVPPIVCLPNLKVLHLRQIEVSDSRLVQRLFSRCCMLEELVVQCHG